jgi:hypothetical protein
MKALGELWSTVSALNHLHTVDMKTFNISLLQWCSNHWDNIGPAGLATVNGPTFSYTVGAQPSSVKTVKKEVEKTKEAAAGKRVESWCTASNDDTAYGLVRSVSLQPMPVRPIRVSQVPAFGKKDTHKVCRSSSLDQNEHWIWWDFGGWRADKNES